MHTYHILRMQKNKKTISINNIKDTVTVFFKVGNISKIIHKDGIEEHTYMPYFAHAILNILYEN